jgi:hypothetical protein
MSVAAEFHQLSAFVILVLIASGGDGWWLGGGQ